jgi:hypothetical protein
LHRAVCSGRVIVTAAVVRAQPPAVTVSTLMKAAEASASLCALLAPKKHSRQFGLIRNYSFN